MLHHFDLARLLAALLVAAGLATPAVARGGDGCCAAETKAVTTKTEKERDIEARLLKPYTLDIRDEPLEQVLDDLRDLTGIDLVPDWAALQDEGISLSRPVKLRVVQLPLKSALTLLLMQVHLTYVVKDDVLQITTKDSARGPLIAKVHLVGDLIAPAEDGRTLMNLMNLAQRNLTRTQGEASGTTGAGGPSSGPPVNTAVAIGTGVAEQGPRPTMPEALIQLITNSVAPQSWTDLGGRGTLQYFPPARALIVSQTADVQEQVAELLAVLRRLREQEVSVDFCFVRMSPRTFTRLAQDFHLTAGCRPASAGASRPAGEAGRRGSSGSGPAGTTLLDDGQLRKLIEAVRADAGTLRCEGVRLTVYAGQVTWFELRGRQCFLTGASAVPGAENLVAGPRLEALPAGMHLAARAIVSEDRRSVSVDLSLDEKPPLIGPAVVFPGPVRVSLAIPAGRTAAVTGWESVREEHQETGPPLLGDLPVLGEPGAEGSPTQEFEYLLVLVTPRVPSLEKDTAACSADTKGHNTRLTKLLRQYERACAEGRLDRAKKLARKALSLDPACFNKKPEVSESAEAER